MRELDQNEAKIVRELIRNPRISDNQIAKTTKIPVMTVNRKRKKLEKENLLRYYASLDTGQEGSGVFVAKQLYIIKFKIGITRHEYLEDIEFCKELRQFSSCFVSLSYLGEKDGHLALILILDAKTESELVDEFNGKIVPHLKGKLGGDSILEVISARITNTIRRHHNYLPFINMEGGIIKKDWPDEWIFVDKIDKAV